MHNPFFFLGIDGNDLNYNIQLRKVIGTFAAEAEIGAE
jgi:hypothetical protein